MARTRSKELVELDDPVVTPLAWPPPLLNTSRSDSTGQQSTHPEDHNAVNAAMNDAVAVLGPSPGGVYGTTTAAVAALTIPNVIRDVARNSSMRIDAGYRGLVVGTDGGHTANGWIHFAFTTPFAAPPIVVVTPADPNNAWLLALDAGTHGAAGPVYVRVFDTAGGLAAPGQTIYLTYIAIGPK